MTFPLLILTAALAGGLVSLVRLWRRASSRGERWLLARFSLFSFMGCLFLGALLFRLPIKYLLLALPPVFFVLVLCQKVLQSAHRRAVQKPAAPDLDRMKRLN
ncbi:MAG: hypothetical protein RLZZ244_2679 [Verrucomicrobiota bacterium]|jgi:hypothetical protein